MVKIDATDTNNYVTGGSYDNESKDLTLNRKDLDDITISLDGLDTNTTYKAGTGIKIEGTDNTISVDTANVNLAYKANSSATSKSVSLEDGLNFVNGTNTTVTVEDNGIVKIDATDTTYDDGKNITIDETNGNKINLNSALGDITSISNGTASISLTKDAGVAINGVSVNKDKTVTGLTNTTLNVEGFGESNRAATEEQLQKVIDKAETAGKGWNLTTNGKQDSKYNVKPKDTVDFTGDGNIAVSNEDNKVKVTLNNSISLSTKVNDVDGTLTINANNGGKISGLTAGTDDKDAVNVSQLKEAAAASKTTVSSGKNVTIKESTKEDGHVDYVVNINKDLEDIESISNGASKITLNDSSLAISNGNKSFTITDRGMGMSVINQTDYSIKSIMVTENGTTISGGLDVAGSKITSVADGAVNATSKDAVNGSQLYDVKQKAEAGWNLTTNGKQDSKYNVKPKDTVDFTGDGNIAVSNEDNKVKVTLNNSISLSTKVNDVDGTLTINANNGGKISGLTAGTDDKDAVNVSQLKEAAAASKTTVSSGKNVTIKESTKEDGHVDYVVNINKDLEDIESISNGASKITLNDSSLAISNGNKSFTITDRGMGMSVINQTDYSIKSIMVTENGTTISGGLDVAGSKITNVAAGTADTDAVNYGQLKDYVSENDKNTHIKAGEYEVDSANKVNMVLVDEKGNEVDTVTITDVAKASEVGKLEDVKDGIKGDTIVDSINKLDNKVGDLQYSKVEEDKIEDGDSTTTAIGKLNNKLSEVEQKAGQHTTVKNGSNNITITPGTNDKKGMEYTIDINKDLNIDSVTAGDTVLNKDGVKVGNDVSLSKDGLNAGGTVVTKDGLTVGDTKVTETGLQIGDKTYVSKDGLNANDQKVTNVADGEVSATSKDAVNGSQLHATNSRIDETNQQVMNNTQNISKLGSRLNKVGAGAAALAALHPMDFDPDDKLTFAAGVGNYGGENAAAIGAYYRPDEKVMFSVGGTMGNGENMVNAGISFALDRTNHVSNSRTAMAREIVDLRAEINELKAMLAKGGLGSIDEDKLKIFPDVAENHWAYEYVGKLAAAGIVEGFPNGEFDGDRMMSRYEFAAMLYRAMQKGAQLDSRIINEFAPEMGRIRVDRISGADNDKRKIERVRVNGTDKAKNDYRDHYGSKIAK